jgi:ElaB/YqjD/DUF883 family membrane-anchored ribosome-binding protein
MDNINQIIKNAEKLMNQALSMKHDDNSLKQKQLDALKDVQEAKEKLNKALEDANNIK